MHASVPIRRLRCLPVRRTVREPTIWRVAASFESCTIKEPGGHFFFHTTTLPGEWSLPAACRGQLKRALYSTGTRVAVIDV
jgi:hypothetical protein